ncbi:unnamed protein product [Leptosia nina]|uniref:EF-hand domain-containing protein n=1 Tax=Leptosia nina TaxID=320188 RepID=A0AAV1K1S7_9NEOP
MVSEFRKKKILYLFKIMCNAESNSTAEKKDYDASVAYILNILRKEKNSKFLKDIEEGAAMVWEGLSSGRDKINAEEWINVWDTGKSELLEWQKMHCKVNFLMQDLAGDGVVDEEEFVRFHVALGMSAEVTKGAFQKMSQGKPKVTWEDFERLYKEYLQSEDKIAPGNYVFGSTKLFM